MSENHYIQSITSLVDEDVIGFSALDPKRGFVGEIVNTLRNQFLGPLSSIAKNFVDFDGQPYLLSTPNSFIVIRVCGHDAYKVKKKTVFARSQIQNLSGAIGKGFPTLTFDHGGESHSFSLLGAAILPGGSYHDDPDITAATQKMRDDMINAVL